MKPEIRRALSTAVDTLKLLKKTDTTLDLNTWIDERFIRQAARAEGLDYDARLKSYDRLPLQGSDARTGEPIREPKLAGQIWVKGEAKVRVYATPQSTLAALKELARQGRVARVAFVHDRETGVKLLADRAFFVEGDRGGARDAHEATVVAAFLTQERARAWAAANHGRVRPPTHVTAAAQP
jgi:NitT/TauT family transport system substrate-binding protein